MGDIIVFPRDKIKSEEEGGAKPRAFLPTAKFRPNSTLSFEDNPSEELYKKGTLVSCAASVIAFVARYGFPVKLKPYKEKNKNQVFLVSSVHQLCCYLSDIFSSKNSVFVTPIKLGEGRTRKKIAVSLYATKTDLPIETILLSLSKEAFTDEFHTYKRKGYRVYIDVSDGVVIYAGLIKDPEDVIDLFK